METYIWGLSRHDSGMNVSNKNVYHDRFNSSNIHVIKNHRKWAQDMTSSCGLHSWAVDLSSQAIEIKMWSRSRYANQSELLGHEYAVLYEYGITRGNPIYVRGCGSIDKRTERRETGNSLSILSNISYCYFVSNMSTANGFLNKFTRFRKMTLSLLCLK